MTPERKAGDAPCQTPAKGGPEAGTTWLAHQDSYLTGEQRAHQFLKRLCDQAEVPRFGYHDIRHAVATYLNDVQLVGVKTVQRWLRHRNQTTTEIYLTGKN